MTIEPAVLSIVGWHAGESVEDIVERKRDDVKKSGRTIWLYHSQLATIPMVQQFGRAFPKAAVIFLKGSAYPTSSDLAAREMSADRNRWEPLPPGIGKVTGKLPGGGLVIGELLGGDNETAGLGDRSTTDQDGLELFRMFLVISAHQISRAVRIR
jgi:hypothetical protein